MTLRVGTSGWSFAGWREIFYPKGLPAGRQLAFASSALTALEINGTFYRLQKPETFRRWGAETTGAFKLAIKGPRYITHIRRGKDLGGALPRFLASGPLELGSKLGPILWQFPPNLAFKDDRMNAFFQTLPGTFHAAAELAETDLPAGMAADTPLHHVFEFRHPSFACSEIYEAMAACGHSWVWGRDSDRSLPIPEVPQQLLYIRMHGDRRGLEEGYSDEELQRFAEELRALQTAHPEAEATYVFFDNEAKTYAPRDAQNLLALWPKAA